MRETSIPRALKFMYYEKVGLIPFKLRTLHMTYLRHSPAPFITSILTHPLVSPYNIIHSSGPVEQKSMCRGTVSNREI